MKIVRWNPFTLVVACIAKTGNWTSAVLSPQNYPYSGTWSVSLCCSNSDIVFKTVPETLKSHGWQREASQKGLLGKRGWGKGPNYSEHELPIMMLCLWDPLASYQQGGVMSPNRRHFVFSAKTSSAQCFLRLASFLCEELASSPSENFSVLMHWLARKASHR